MLRFIHTEDIHLDSPLVGLRFGPDAPTAFQRTKTRDAVTRLVANGVDHEVELTVIAGALHDGHARGGIGRPSLKPIKLACL